VSRVTEEENGNTSKLVYSDFSRRIVRIQRVYKPAGPLAM